MKLIWSHSRFNNKAAIMLAAAGGMMLPGAAMAQTAPISGMISAVCSLIGPLVGKSQFVSLIFLVMLAVMIFLWWMSENKEGVIVWVLRTGMALGVIINIFTLPSLIGLPSVCS